jgi:hypothetical protein
LVAAVDLVADSAADLAAKETELLPVTSSQ